MKFGVDLIHMNCVNLQWLVDIEASQLMQKSMFKGFSIQMPTFYRFLAYFHKSTVKNTCETVRADVKFLCSIQRYVKKQLSMQGYLI